MPRIAPRPRDSLPTDLPNRSLRSRSIWIHRGMNGAISIGMRSSLDSEGGAAFVDVLLQQYPQTFGRPALLRPQSRVPEKLESVVGMWAVRGTKALSLQRQQKAAE